MTKRIAILQSNYIPWRGYFDLIGLVDEFVILDGVQFTKDDWRNRNRIPDGKDGLWLTIPVKTAGKPTQRIDETEIADARWARKHWSTLAQRYARAPHFKAYESEIGALYEAAAAEPMLSTVNLLFLRGICSMLGITTSIAIAADIETQDKTDRLIKLCGAHGAGAYLSGPAAREYIDVAQFEAASIALEFMDYSAYRPYPQLQAPFDSYVSALDLIFNVGPDARAFLKSGV